MTMHIGFVRNSAIVVPIASQLDCMYFNNLWVTPPACSQHCPGQLAQPPGDAVLRQYILDCMFNFVLVKKVESGKGSGTQPGLQNEWTNESHIRTTWFICEDTSFFPFACPNKSRHFPVLDGRPFERFNQSAFSPYTSVPSSCSTLFDDFSL